MQHVKSKREQALVRAAAQLIDIGYQAACYVCKPGITDHEIFAAFTFAQMARGGESGDGYQLGINKYGTHVSKPYGNVVKPGDIINLYISGVTYRGYNAQAARMIIVGDINRKQEEVIEMCMEGFQKAMEATRPGALIREVNNAGFEPFIRRGYLTSPEAREMPWNWSANPDGSPRRIPFEYHGDRSLNNEGSELRHVYPATSGPNGPRLGHSIGMPGMPLFRVISSNYRQLQSGMTFVVLPQWYEPKTVGCNLGSTLLVTDNGVENLNSHSSLEPYRVKT
jgi:Xaa-Pro aminopeptidase